MEDFLRRPAITLAFNDTRMKFWSNEAKDWLAKDTARMLLDNENIRAYRAEFGRKKSLCNDSQIERDDEGAWFDIKFSKVSKLAFGISLRLDTRGDTSMYTDG